LIDFPLTKWSRRTRPTVSTINIPRHPLPEKRTAHQTRIQGVKFARRSPGSGGQICTPKHIRRQVTAHRHRLKRGARTTTVPNSDTNCRER
jgi:hypothetical protein